VRALALDEVDRHIRDDREVLGTVHAAFRVDAERGEHDVLTEVNSVHEHGPHVEVAEGARHPLREHLRREPQEPE
jgi:hypothetical protein